MNWTDGHSSNQFDFHFKASQSNQITEKRRQIRRIEKQHLPASLFCFTKKSTSSSLPSPITSSSSLHVEKVSSDWLISYVSPAAAARTNELSLSAVLSLSLSSSSRSLQSGLTAHSTSLFLSAAINSE